MTLPDTLLFADCIASPATLTAPATPAAVEAMVDFDRGARTGKWDPFLARLAPDATLVVPAPGFAERGLLRGRAAAAEVFAYHDGVAGLAWSVRTLATVGDEVVFEAVVETDPDGPDDAPAVSLLLLLILVMADDAVAHLREYAVYTGDSQGWGEDNTTTQAFSYRRSS